MIDETSRHPNRPFVPQAGARARLLIDGLAVGEIVVQGWNSSWAFGRFTPNDSFATYAPLFGVWSLLMHEDEHAPLHKTASDELADAERKIDALHVQVHFLEQDLRIPVGQLNIDGELVEWKVL